MHEHDWHRNGFGVRPYCSICGVNEPATYGEGYAEGYAAGVAAARAAVAGLSTGALPDDLVWGWSPDGFVGFDTGQRAALAAIDAIGAGEET